MCYTKVEDFDLNAYILEEVSLSLFETVDSRYLSVLDHLTVLDERDGVPQSWGADFIERQSNEEGKVTLGLSSNNIGKNLHLRKHRKKGIEQTVYGKKGIRQGNSSDH